MRSFIYFISVKKVAIAIYIAGFLVLIFLWEWQKTISGALGEIIAFVVYVTAFFYPFSYHLFAHLDKKQTIGEWLKEDIFYAERQKKQTQRES